MSLFCVSDGELRQLVSQGGPIGIYARLELAKRRKAGVKLTADEVCWILRDDAVSAAIITAVEQLRDPGFEP